MTRVPTALIAVLLVSSLSAQARPAAGQSQKAVLVTGASSGIGRKMTEVLASRGFFIYAGARSARDLEDLSTIPNVQAVRLDVTSAEEIAAAVETVERAGRGLYGVINNAGVAIIGPLIELTDADANFVFDVNVMGPLRITRAFSRLLIASKGRVVTTGSISGILAEPLGGVYAMSKHAVEAYTDALAAEMARVGVKVSVIEPGNYRSEMGQNVLRHMKERGQTVEGSLFEPELRRMLAGVEQMAKLPEPDDVAEAAFQALTDPTPKIRYMVVPNQAQANMTIHKQLLQLAQLNQAHRYSVSRDSLVAMLDRALAEVK